MSDCKQPTHHDDCENCQRERKENQQYIAVYQRMQNLRKNVEKTANAVKNHSQYMRTVRTLSKSLDASMIKAVKCQGENDSRSVSSVGFEIASCMVERQVKKKMEDQNEYLRKRIQAMRKKQESTLQEEPLCSLPKINENKNKFNASLTSNTVSQIQNKKPSCKEQQSHTNNVCNNTIYNDNDSYTTKFSLFKNTRGLNSSTYRQKYRNMNLWLYQSQNFNDSKYPFPDPAITTNHYSKNKQKII